MDFFRSLPAWQQWVLAAVAIIAIGELVSRYVARLRARAKTTIYRFDASSPTPLGAHGHGHGHHNEEPPPNLLMDDPKRPPAIADSHGVPRIICPCCGYPTARDATGLGECLLCEWADPVGSGRPAGDARAQYASALAMAKDNFAQYGSAVSPDERESWGSAPLSAEESRARDELRQHYDYLMSGTRPDAPQTWQRIDALVEQLLDAAQRRMDSGE